MAKWHGEEENQNTIKSMGPTSDCHPLNCYRFEHVVGMQKMQIQN